jgi:predicted small metal-binding protein
MRGPEVFEFVCDRIIPGCKDVERGDTHEKVLEQAMDHLREDHGMDYIDKPWGERVRTTGIIQVPGR